jgi:hypothetical protein
MRGNNYEVLAGVWEAGRCGACKTDPMALHGFRNQATLRGGPLYYPGKNETRCDYCASIMLVRHVTLRDYIHLQDCVTMLTDCGKVTLNVHKPCNRLQLWRPAIGSRCSAQQSLLYRTADMSSKNVNHSG